MNTTRSLWPVGIIATFAVFICATISLVIVASSQRTDLVNADYYEQEIKFQSRIDAEKRAQQIGASISYEAAQKQIVVSLPADHAAKSVVGEIRLYRPSGSALDKQIKLRPDANGVQTVEAATLQKGPWQVHASWVVAGQEYFLEYKFVVSDVIKTAAR